MKYHLLFFTFITTLFITRCAIAQYNLPQNNVWIMGNKVGLDFNATAGPVAISSNLDSAMSGGAASVCDDNGQLLFYTNGNNVWTANGDIMPNGHSITGGFTGIGKPIQSSLIVPCIKEDAKRDYYLFTLSGGTYYPLSLYCNQVNMALNNGNGDVDTSFALIGTMFSDSLSGKMIAIPGCNNNIWVLVFGYNKPIFKAYEITDTGINLTPVISDFTAMFPDYYNYYNGEMKVSPDRSKILVCNYQYPSFGLAVFNFNYSTGQVYNPTVLDNDTSYFSGAFSPNSTKIYAREEGTINGFNTYQFRLDEDNPAGSKTLINTFNNLMNAMRLAPDGKIYFGSSVEPLGFGYRNLGCINFPDSNAAECAYQDTISGIEFPLSGTETGLFQEFPNEVVLPGIGLNPVSLHLSNDTLYATNGYINYHWYYNDTLISDAYGSYYVVSGNGWYTVTVDDGGPCSDTDSMEVTTSTGINNLSDIQKSLQAYPNPASDYIEIKPFLTAFLSITDIQGRAIISPKRTNNLNIQQLPAGTYFLKVENDKQKLIKIFKIVKR